MGTGIVLKMSGELLHSDFFLFILEYGEDRSFSEMKAAQRILASHNIIPSMCLLHLLKRKMQ